MAQPLTEDQIQQVLARFRTEGKLAAVKLYRQFGGCSLLKAKEDVEALATGKSVAPADVSSELKDATMDEVLDLIQAGRKIDAVKVYRSNSGLSLLESKEFIEQLMQELEIEQPDSVPRGSGCGSAVLLMAILASSIVAAVLSIA